MSNIIEQLTLRVSELEKQMANVCRIAQVKKVHEDTALLDVTFEGLEIQQIPFLTQRAGEDKVYWLPSKDELGLLFSPSGDIANAFFLPGIFYNTFPAAESSLTTSKRIFRDGTTEEIDTDAHTYKLAIGNRDASIPFASESETEDEDDTPYIKIDNKETEIKRKAGTITLDSASKIEAKVGIAKMELTSGSAKIEFSPAVKILLGAAGITIEFSSTVKILLGPTGITLIGPTINNIGLLQVGTVPLMVP